MFNVGSKEIGQASNDRGVPPGYPVERANNYPRLHDEVSRKFAFIDPELSRGPHETVSDGPIDPASRGIPLHNAQRLESRFTGKEFDDQ